MSVIKLGAAIMAASLAMQGVSFAADDSARHCFFSSQFNNWKAADDKTMFIRVGVNRYFRVEFANGCQTLTWPNAILVTQFRGSNTVCSAIDWDLKVSQGPHGITEACIVSQMTELTPAEVAALPKKAKP